MELGSLSVIVGKNRRATSCNLRCPFCISKQPQEVGLSSSPPEELLPIKRIAFLAEMAKPLFKGFRYGIITGKGEPTMAPESRMIDIIDVLYDGGSGYIPELQTNGTLLTVARMKDWHARGLNTVALSCVSHRDEVNSRMLSDDRVTWELGNLVREARDCGLLVRLTVIVTKGGVDNLEAFLAFAEWAKDAGAHQLTFRRMGEPRDLRRPGSQVVADWIREHSIEPGFIIDYLRQYGREKDPLPWAQWFTFEGMSGVVTDHMNAPKDGVARHAVIQPDGHLYSSWDDTGDI